MRGLPAEELLTRALRGDAEAAGALLERFQPYLRLMAQRQMDSAVQTRLDPSDVVQQTCLEAYRDLAGFRGRTQGELLAWLRQILHNNVAQTIQRHVLAQKRSTRKERRLDGRDSSGGELQQVLASEQSTPSQRAMRGERAVRLAEALERIPEDQRHAVRLRHLEGWSLAQIAEYFGRSEVAVAGLLKRGLRSLRKHLAHSLATEENTHERSGPEGSSPGRTA